MPGLSSSTASPVAAPLRLAVGVATSGRPLILGDTLADLSRQTRKPDHIFVTYSKPDDVGDLPGRFPEITFAQGQGGLCEKRNRIMEAAAGYDLIFFMDDDFYLDPGYLESTERAFSEDRSIVATTGVVVADGAKGPGLTFADAMLALDQAQQSQIAQSSRPAAFNTYGCNMAFRLATVREQNLRFDEKLPAYAWYEDMDFSRRLARFGSMVRLEDALGVHLGAKVGRVSGLRLGYSQVANPIYLSRKGSFPWGNTFRSVGRHLLANLAKSVSPEPYIDRRGRLRGNLLAFREALQGRMSPDRILELH